jgi:prepilin-type N-terminal cleavage/methylation domain-containing protein
MLLKRCKTKEKANCDTMPHGARGVSLIEIIVVVSILAIVSLIILVKHQTFNSHIILGSLTYDVALSLREAQVFGLAVREEALTDSFDIGYGIHFDENLNDKYTLFSDVNNDSEFNAGDNTLREYSIGRGIVISKFCATPVGSTVEICSPGGITFLDIVFKRPDPEAYFSTSGGGTYSQVRIELLAPKGTTREVEVLATGQISVLPN